MLTAGFSSLLLLFSFEFEMWDADCLGFLCFRSGEIVRLRMDWKKGGWFYDDHEFLEKYVEVVELISEVSKKSVSCTLDNCAEFFSEFWSTFFGCLFSFYVFLFSPFLCLNCFRCLNL